MDHKRTKLVTRMIKCVFLCYAPNNKAYRILNLEFVHIWEIWVDPAKSRHRGKTEQNDQSESRGVISQHIGMDHQLGM